MCLCLFHVLCLNVLVLVALTVIPKFIFFCFSASVGTSGTGTIKSGGINKHTSPVWVLQCKLRPDRPRNRSNDQIRRGNNLPPADLWMRAVNHGHRGATLRPVLAMR